MRQTTPDTKPYDPDFYKVAYEGYELLHSYTSSELENYRALLLQKTQTQAEFIADELRDTVSKRGLRVAEFCSGNGRLFVSLSKMGVLELGLGIEISSSRVQFAEKWRQDCGLDKFTNVRADVLKYEDYRQTTLI